MQRNTILFLVLALAILIGWSGLMHWMYPPGTLVAVVPDGVSLEGAKVLVKQGDQSPRIWSVGEHAVVPITPGKYDLELNPAPEGVALETTSVEVFGGQETKVQFTKRAPLPKADARLAGKLPLPPEPADITPKLDAQPAPKGPPAAPRRRITLGSANPSDPYHMLVTFDTRGAVVERIELNSDRYRDLEDRAGYLGHLAAENAPQGQGAIVNVVGPGTPAAQAGLQSAQWERRDDEFVKTSWDVITAIDNQPVANAEQLDAALQATRPKQRVVIAFERHRLGKPPEKHTGDVTLTARPLQVVRPEIENAQLRVRHETSPWHNGVGDPLSFLLTLQQIGDRQITDEVELADVDLRSANWEPLPPDPNRPHSLAFRRQLHKYNLEVIKTYTLSDTVAAAAADATLPAAYHLTLDVTVRNLSDQPISDVALQLDGPTGLPTEGAWYARGGLRDYAVGLRKGNGVVHVSTKCAAISAKPDGNDGVRMTDKEPDPTAYVGVDSQYFAAVILPQQEDRIAGTRWLAVGEVDHSKKNRTNISCRLITKPAAIEPGQSLSHQFVLFAGPKATDLLRTYGLEAYFKDGTWLWPPIYNVVTRPLQWILHVFYGLVHNYGVAIVMLTILVRLCMFRLSLKQARSAIKMQELQPEIKRIQEQHAKNLEARNKALGELFRKHNYHPLAGCLPMLVQMPIFIGLYWSLAMDIELRQAPLAQGLWWCSNLAAPDMLFDWSRWAPSFIQNGWTILPAMGPYLNILPLVTMVLFIAQQKMFMPPPANDQAALQMKIMQYMMIYMTLLFYLVPSGLCIYFIASSLWGLAERKFLPKATPAAAPGAAATASATAPFAQSYLPDSNGSTRRKKRRSSQK